MLDIVSAHGTSPNGYSFENRGIFFSMSQQDHSDRKISLRKIAANKALWCEGDERAAILVVQSGAVCFSRMLPDGRRIVLGFAYPGDIIGLGSDIHNCDARTLQATRLSSMPIRAFKRTMAEDLDFRRQANTAVNKALDHAYNHVVMISRLSACERLASFLVALSSQNAIQGLEPSSVVLPMKRIDIADYLGLTIETVSRTFTQFKASGLIEMEQSSIIVFKDLRKLHALADGEVALAS